MITTETILAFVAGFLAFPILVFVVGLVLELKDPS